MTWLPALAVSLLLTVVAALENTVAPWAPFYVVYAALALGVPLLLRQAGFGSLRRPRLRYWLAAVGLAVALQGLFRLITRGAELPEMFGRVFVAAGDRLAAKPETVAKWYLIFIQVWAGLGEEVFYRDTCSGTCAGGSDRCPASEPPRWCSPPGTTRRC